MHVGVRMLDDVLDVTAWPLPEQQQEAQNKRRIGLGYTGLGDALIMIGLRYDTGEARAFAAPRFRNQADDRQGLQGMWQRHADPEGRLRVLHQLRNDRGVRLRLAKRVSGNM